MSKSIRRSIARAGLSLTVTAAVLAGMVAGLLASQPNHADAALKWSEHATTQKTKDNNKDGLKHIDPTPAPDSTTTTP